MLSSLFKGLGITTPAIIPSLNQTDHEDDKETDNRDEEDSEYNVTPPPRPLRSPTQPSSKSVHNHLLLSPVITKKYTSNEIRILLCSLVMSTYQQNEKPDDIMNDVQSMFKELEEYMPHNPEMGPSSPLRSPPKLMRNDIFDFISTLAQAANLQSGSALTFRNTREQTPESPLKRKSSKMAEDSDEEDAILDDESSTVFSATESGNPSICSRLINSSLVPSISITEGLDITAYKTIPKNVVAVNNKAKEGDTISMSSLTMNSNLLCRQ